MTSGNNEPFGKEFLHSVMVNEPGDRWPFRKLSLGEAVPIGFHGPWIAGEQYATLIPVKCQLISSDQLP